MNLTFFPVLRPIAHRYLPMENSFKLLLTSVGEPSWEAKLRQHLEGYNIACAGVTPQQVAACEAKLGAALPADMCAYYLAFGDSQSSDFMYGLLPIAEVQPLATAGYEFISLYFTPGEIDGLVWFAESPGNDPLCFAQATGALYLFSHDPVRKAKVFTDFSQYLLFELIQLETLLGEGLDEKSEQQLADRYLAGEGIDYAFRTQKL
jgi:hypothetical protein